MNNSSDLQRPALSRRAFLRLALAGAAGVTASACLPFQMQPTPQARSRVELVYQDWRTDWFPPMAQAMLEEFHASHPNIRVFYIPDPENLEDKMLADMQAGSAADVFQGCCAFFPIWAQQGYTLDLRPFVNADLDQETIDDWDEAQYRSFFTQDGKQYGLPKYHGALALYYNKDAFDEREVAYPDGTWDHDDYLDAMHRLTRREAWGASIEMWGSMMDISWDRIQAHVNGWGGRFVDADDPTICRMSEPPALEAMEWIRARMWDDRVLANGPAVRNLDTRQAFASGKVAMVEDGSWSLKAILSQAEFRVGVAPFPAGPRRRVTLASTDGFGIYSGTRYPEAAWELLKFLISKDYGRAMARAHFLQPARRSLVEEWVGYIRAEFPQKTRDMDIAAFADGHIKGYSVTAEILPNNMFEAMQLANDAWDRIFTLGQAPVSHMRSVCHHIQNAQRQAGSGG